MVPDVLCAGIIVADHVCAPIAHLPDAGELVTTQEMILTIGGCASNCAVDLARMGVRPALAGRVGNDAFGRIVGDMLQEQGVDTSALKVSHSRPTSQTMIVNVAGQDRRFIHIFGANAEFAAEDIPSDLARRCKVFYLGGYLIMPFLTQEKLIPVFDALRQAGTKVLIDVATPGKRDYLPHLDRLLGHVDVFHCNNHEGKNILGENDPLRQAEAFHRLGAETAVVTLGADGAFLVSSTSRLKAGAFSVPFVDGSGGGDAFCAGYIYGLLKGSGVEDCLLYASALGASCVRAIGTTPGVFTEHECLDFLSKNQIAIDRI